MVSDMKPFETKMLLRFRRRHGAAYLDEDMYTNTTETVFWQNSAQGVELTASKSRQLQMFVYSTTLCFGTCALK